MYCIVESYWDIQNMYKTYISGVITLKGNAFTFQMSIEHCRCSA